MYYDNDNHDSFLGTIFLGALFFLFHLDGKQAAYEEIEKENMKKEIENFKRRFEEIKG